MNVNPHYISLKNYICPLLDKKLLGMLSMAKEKFSDR